MADLVERYFRDLREIRSSGMAVKETSYYPALSNLLNGVGATLKPRVRCVINLKNAGAGIPDGGLFTPDQLRTGDEEAPLLGQVPARGVLEAKGTAADVRRIAAGEQVGRYLERYGQVLVTSYRDFLLVERGQNGMPVLGEAYELAPSEAAFWGGTVDARSLAREHEERFLGYLQRVLLHRAPLAAPEDVAFFLASYARDATARIEHRGLPGLTTVRQGLEQALGLRFEGERGDHFFRSTLVQTLFYGVFSAWVLWSKDRATGDDEWFDWRDAAWMLRVPALQVLFEQLAAPSRLTPLGLVEPLDWAGAALNRVDRATFFARFAEDHAVQYFYEPFLEQFDPELRKELGVWYTPAEVVAYMVERVDAVLHRIARTLRERGEAALLGEDLKKAALTRIHGFEILPAPFVVAHLQLGLALQREGAPLDEGERPSIYLTNALTGWDPPTGPKAELMFPELAAERDAADHVKRDTPILVVIGNPPYNAFAGISPAQEAGLVEPYKTGLNKPVVEGGWGIRKFNLDDLYVRFFRLAERKITEGTGQGVVCYISNFSYLGDPSFVVMRQRFLREFDALWFDSLNGDSRETGKLTPEGKPDPSIFSTCYNREGIRVGTAIGLMVRKERREPEPTVRFREFWGAGKAKELADSSAVSGTDEHYQIAQPERINRFSFRPSSVDQSYSTWPSLPQLADRPPFAGLAEDRRKSLIGIDRHILSERMRHYFDPNVDWDRLSDQAPDLTNDLPRFDARATRKAVLARESFDDDRILPFAMRPFDVQWCYYSPIRPLWREPRPEYWARYQSGTPSLVTRFKASKSPEGPPIAFARQLCDYHMMPPNSSVIPLQLRETSTPPGVVGVSQAAMFAHGADRSWAPNLSSSARAYLGALGIGPPDGDPETAELVWMHAFAIGYSPAYLTENADGVQQDWPRIPLPASRDVLLASAALGREVAALLDTETPLPGVTDGTVRSELRTVAVIARDDGAQLNVAADDLALTAGWGYGGRGTATMPGRGKVTERGYAAAERAALAAWRNPLGLAGDSAFAPLGETTFDVFLNDRVCWRNVPARVWGYRIGGYQVIKKWLSYRETDLLRRPLTVEEAREVTRMARRIAALLLLEPQLDANYRAVTAGTYAWPSTSTDSPQLRGQLDARAAVETGQDELARLEQARLLLCFQRFKRLQDHRVGVGIRTALNPVPNSVLDVGGEGHAHGGILLAQA